jgi:hypothetical protein
MIRGSTGAPSTLDGAGLEKEGQAAVGGGRAWSRRAGAVGGGRARSRRAGAVGGGRARSAAAGRGRSNVSGVGHSG